MITTKLYLMKQLYTATFLTLLITVIATALQAQVTLSANGPGDTYALIESEGFGVESPDCRHTSFGPHIHRSIRQYPQQICFSFSIAIP